MALTRNIQRNPDYWRFLASIRDSQATGSFEYAPVGAFADWLEEHGDPRAALVRGAESHHLPYGARPANASTIPALGYTGVSAYNNPGERTSLHTAMSGTGGTPLVHMHWRLPKKFGGGTVALTTAVTRDKIGEHVARLAPAVRSAWKRGLANTFAIKLSREEDQRSFHRAMWQNPDDATSRAVYADWLDEHDQPEAARRLRWWAGVLPHLEPKESDSGPPFVYPTRNVGDRHGTLPQWARQLLVQHALRKTQRASRHPEGSADRASVIELQNRTWPGSELHALGLLAQEPPSPAGYTAPERASQDHSHAWGPSAHNLETAEKYNKQHGIVKLSRSNSENLLLAHAGAALANGHDDAALKSFADHMGESEHAETPWVKALQQFALEGKVDQAANLLDADPRVGTPHLASGAVKGLSLNTPNMGLHGLPGFHHDYPTGQWRPLNPGAWQPDRRRRMTALQVAGGLHAAGGWPNVIHAVIGLHHLRPTKGPVKLAAIEPPSTAQPSVLVKVPVPTPVEPKPAPAPAPAAAPAPTRKAPQSAGPVFFLPQ